MLDDFYDELQPIGRFETVARLAKQALTYYDSLPLSMRTPETQRNRAMAQARLAWVTAQQGQFKSANELAEEAASRLEQMRRQGDETEETAYALALALLAEAWEGFQFEDAPATAAPLQRGLEVLRPFALSPNASTRSKLLYADLLNFLSHAQKFEEGVATCQGALSILEGLGVLNWSDLDAASAWADIADSQAREMLGLVRATVRQAGWRQGRLAVHRV